MGFKQEKRFQRTKTTIRASLEEKGTKGGRNNPKKAGRKRKCMQKQKSRGDLLRINDLWPQSVKLVN